MTIEFTHPTVDIKRDRWDRPLITPVDGGTPIPYTRVSTLAKVPDLDKLLRSTFDAITTAGVWRDDAQVVVVSASKSYADTFPPGALITLEATRARP